MFGLFHPRWTRAEVLVSAGLVLLLLLLAAAGDTAREVLRYDRTLIDTGQWWRLASGHFVHLGLGHLLLDTTGLALLLLFFRDVFSPRDWALAIAISALATGLALYLRDPSLARYVGISGVLHTLLFAGLLLSIHHNPVINGIVLAVMCQRLWSEQQPGFDVNHMQSVIGGAVAVDAHFYGALAALPVVALLWRRSRARQARFRGADADR